MKLFSKTKWLRIENQVSARIKTKTNKDDKVQQEDDDDLMENPSEYLQKTVGNQDGAHSSTTIKNVNVDINKISEKEIKNWMS